MTTFRDSDGVTRFAGDVLMGGTVGDVATVQADGTLAPASGGSQAYVSVTLQHSAAFVNLRTNAPVVAAFALFSAITLPATAFGNDGQVSVTVTNPNDFDVQVGASLIVQNDDGTVWIGQDTTGTQTIPASLPAQLDFDAGGGGAGVGLSWNALSKQVDIANAGAYSAVLCVYAQPV